MSMDIIVTNKTDTPMYQQIKDQIISAILENKLKEGAQLDSTRGLAKKICVSVITVTRAYNELEEEGYIVAQPAKGYYVADKNNELFKERLIFTITSHFEEAVILSRRLGLSNNEIMQILKNELGDGMNE